MQTEKVMRLFRRIASLVLVICFVLPLSQCDAKKYEDEKTVPVRYHPYGYQLLVGGLQEIRIGNVVGGALVFTITSLVFFLPVVMWKASAAKQALAHIVLALVAGYAVYTLLFVMSTRPLVGGILLTVCWTVLFLLGCVTLVQALSRWCCDRKE